MGSGDRVVSLWSTACVAVVFLLVAAAVPAGAAGASSIVTAFGDGRAAVHAERIPFGRLLLALHEVTPLDQVRIDPAVRGRRVTVHLEGISRSELTIEVLQAAGVDFLIWGSQIVLGDPVRAVPFGDVPWGVEGPELQVAEAGPEAYTGASPGVLGLEGPAAPGTGDDERSEVDTIPAEPSPAAEDDRAAAITAEMRASFAALPLEERAEARARFLGRSASATAFDPAAIRAEQAAAEEYVTPDFRMVGESVTYSDPNFVPYKNRPEVRARRLSVDVSTIP